MYEKDLHNIVLKHCILVIPLFVAHVCFSAIASDVCDGNPPENSTTIGFIEENKNKKKQQNLFHAAEEGAEKHQNRFHITKESEKQQNRLHVVNE